MKAQTRGGDRKSDQSATLHFDSAEKRAAESGLLPLALLADGDLAANGASADTSLGGQFLGSASAVFDRLMPTCTKRFLVTPRSGLPLPRLPLLVGLHRGDCIGELGRREMPARGVLAGDVGHRVLARVLGEAWLNAVIGTSLDRTRELDALKDMAPDVRRELIDRAKAGEKVTAKLPMPEKDPQLASRLVPVRSGRSRLVTRSNRGAGAGAGRKEARTL